MTDLLSLLFDILDMITADQACHVYTWFCVWALGQTEPNWSKPWYLSSILYYPKPHPSKKHQVAFHSAGIYMRGVPEVLSLYSYFSQYVR